jgi:hypothetical protein
MNRVTTWFTVPLLIAALAGCSGWTSRPWFSSGDTRGYWLPLTVNLALDPTVTNAGFDYTDACQKPQVLAFGDGLTKSVTREVGMAFEHVQDGSKPAKVQPDGTVQVSLGLKELRLVIPRQETNTYSANVTLGGTVTYLDETGAVLFSKSLRTEAKGTVETERDSCKVSGLEPIVAQAAVTLSQGFKTNLGTATPIRQAAASRKEGTRPPPVASAAAPTGLATPGPAPADVPAPTPQGASSGPVTLAFRAMLRDENQDHVFDGSEQVTVDVEVSNRGAEAAKGVKVTLRGTPALIQMLQNPILVGDLQPGESKHVTVSGSLPSVTAVQQAELIISVEASGGLTNPLRPKKFLVALRPAKAEAVEVLSVDVDQVPVPPRNSERKKAVGIAIGLGNYRDRDMPGVKFAARDAEIVAKYFRAVSGVPAKGSRVLTDEHALKEDLAETFEEWLPQHAEPGGAVFIFFAGRGVVDPLTGAVSLIPHEGNVGAPLRSYSLRRLHQALAALPIHHAVLMLDVTLMVPPGTVLPDGHAGGVDPIWGTPDVADGKLVQMIGVSRTQLTHQYDQGKHGLFTYFLLKGLGGEADRDKNGVVVAGELFEYAQRQVAVTAKADFGNEQEPACVPALVPTSKAWNLPVAKLR